MEPTGMSAPTRIEPAYVVPQAPDVERAVLGALLISPEAWPKVADLLSADLFYETPNQHVYRIARALWTDGRPVDLVTVVQALAMDGHLETVGGAVFVAGLTTSIASTANIEYHVRILTERHIARRIITICNSTATNAKENEDAFDLLDRMSADVSDLYGFAQPTVLKTAASDLHELTDKVSSTHYTFGIPALDEKVVFQAGLPHVFAGRPGMGKSIISIHVMWHLTQAGNVLFFSPEMTLRQVQARIVSMETGVPYSRILSRKMDEQELDNVSACVMRIADRMGRMFVDPASGITPEQIRVRTERAMKLHGIIAVGVDHLHKMSTGDGRVDREETARVSQCMEGLTEAAKNTGLPFMVAAQLNRQVESREDKRPKLSDLKQTGKIEEDAAVVVLMYRDGYYTEPQPHEDLLELMVAKNRDGSTGMTTAPIIPAYNRIGATPKVPAFDTRIPAAALKSFTEPNKDEDEPAPF
jgi:replicative DNA helicase